MKRDFGNIAVYLLIDNGMLQEFSAAYTEVDVNSRPIWLEPIYTKRALEVSPLLIDVEAAYNAGDIENVMCYVKARKPALHVSIIESDMSLAEIAQHLRRFIFILDPNGQQFTLRFADCAVLSPLCSLLTSSQWASMTVPLTRWLIHDRAGSITSLPFIKSDTHAPVPLRFDQKQLAVLDDSSEPDHFIAKVKTMRHDAELPGTAAEQHDLAREARKIWRDAQNFNPLFLLFLTEATLISQGKILRRTEIKDLLRTDQVSMFREKLQDMAVESEDKGIKFTD